MGKVGHLHDAGNVCEEGLWPGVLLGIHLGQNGRQVHGLRHLRCGRRPYLATCSARPGSARRLQLGAPAACTQRGHARKGQAAAGHLLGPPWCRHAWGSPAAADRVGSGSGQRVLLSPPPASLWSRPQRSCMVAATCGRAGEDSWTSPWRRTRGSPQGPRAARRRPSVGPPAASWQPHAAPCAAGGPRPGPSPGQLLRQLPWQLLPR